MLKYLIIQLDDRSVSFCHYDNDRGVSKLIGLDTLKKALFWSMKENLTVQFLYPDSELPLEYKQVISDIDHGDMVAATCDDEKLREQSAVVVFDRWDGVARYPLSLKQAYVIRTTFEELLRNESIVSSILPKVSRLNVIIRDIEDFNEEAQEKYSQLLDRLNGMVYQEYKNGHGVQLNVSTDRMMLDKMNNCNAGDESITLAPDGKFYICPGFYLDGSGSVGDVESGLDIKNRQLYRLDHAPICRICDAWHCKRCVWQNKNMTLEVNTPSHEQCVMAHIEREASRKLLEKIRTIGQFLPGKEIKELGYLDPFDEVLNRQ